MEPFLRRGLLTPIDDISVEAPTSNEFDIFLHFVNVLEGIKTQIKNVHWASLKLPIGTREEHTYTLMTL